MRRRIVLAATALVLVAAACGGSDEEPTQAPTAGPTTPPATPAPQTSPPSDQPSPTTDAPQAPPATTTAAPSKPPVDVSASAADGWQLTGIAPGVKPELALDGSGSPSMTWLFERVGEGFVAFAEAVDGWSVQTVREGYFYGPIDLAFDPQGVPFIAYHDHQADDFDLELGDLAIATWNGERWAVEQVRDDGHDGWDSAIVISSTGTIHAAGVDPSQFRREDGVEYYVNDGSGWEITAIGSGPIAYRHNVALALGPDEEPALSYYNDRQDTQDLMFATFDGASWNLEAVDTIGDVGKYPSLAFDRQGRAHISYFYQESETTGMIRHAVQGDSGWTFSDVASIDAFEYGIARRNSSIAIDSAGTPHIAFSDTSGVWYAVADGDGWGIQKVASSGSLPLGQLVSLVLDGDDVPHIGFYEVTRGNPLDGIVIYATTL